MSLNIDIWLITTKNMGTDNKSKHAMLKQEMESYIIIIGAWAHNKDINKQSEDTWWLMWELEQFWCILWLLRVKDKLRYLLPDLNENIVVYIFEENEDKINI